MNKPLRLGYSPCPNDTFIFYALKYGKIDTEGLSFEIVHADVEALNDMAFSATLDITKLSYHAWMHLLHLYALLPAGSALGRNCGPLLISKKSPSTLRINEVAVALPGRYTTAHLLFSLAFPQAANKRFGVFSDIEDMVLNEEVEAGVIIHENRFTYAQKGLFKVMDLGENWEQSTGQAIPLGGICCKRSLPDALKRKIARVLHRSVQYAFDHPDETMPYVSCHAQEMSEAVMRQHIALYVNEFTLDLGSIGLGAVHSLLKHGQEIGILGPVLDYEIVAGD